MESAISPERPATATAKTSFKILTLNTHKGFSAFNRKFVLHELREAVRGVHADIVFLQEVHGAHEGHSKRHATWPKTPQYEFLADQIWSAHAYGRNAVYPAGDHGNALLSKFPILHHQNHDVSITGPEQRGMLHCQLHVPQAAQPVHAICVHLGLREPHRREQLRLMCQLIEREIPPSAPLVIAGDFNDWRVSAASVLDQCAGLREVFVETAGREARTFPVRWPLLRLDRIYVRNLRVRKPEVLSAFPWSQLSDHAALMTEVEL